MAASYKKLFKLLIDRDMKKKELAEKAGISIATITKMGKDGAVVTNLISHFSFLCNSLFFVYCGANFDLNKLSLRVIITV